MKALFSRKCEYALMAVLYIATKEKDTVVSVDEIAAQLNIPKEFVSKILQSLRINKIIASRKGKKGGFLLAKPAGKITLLDIVIAIDGSELFDACVVGFPDCSSQNPCPVHNKWKKIREDIYKLFKKYSLKDLKTDFLKKIEKELKSIK